ncbi:follicle cell protein 3C-1 [Toxorhynchites rutilus septentrionalis]|uniref:follicle cell protein 3C-1 n=1 Tax=Toxorhynchites rutilus septentrionalis TaxID=329112 RepID=UPI00247914F0|nr:follicle cell protein 3C-1 [Toxorhynchites rutilus septentrionalis]
MVNKIRVVVIIIKLTVVMSFLCVETAKTPKVRPRKAKQADLASNSVKQTENVPCSCAIFLTGQFNKFNRSEPPRGNPGIQMELMQHFPCSTMGNKQCSNRCLDAILKHLPNSPALICGTIDRDCFRERPYLFYQNCSPRWVNSNLSAGKEFCCQNDRPVRCTKMAAVIRQKLLIANSTTPNKGDEEQLDASDE